MPQKRKSEREARERGSETERGERERKKKERNNERKKERKKERERASSIPNDLAIAGNRAPQASLIAGSVNVQSQVIAFGGGPIALQGFVRICDKKLLQY